MVGHIRFVVDRRGESRIRSNSAAPVPRETRTAALSAPRRFRALRMSGKRLRTCLATVGLRGEIRNQRKSAAIWHILCLNRSVRIRGAQNDLPSGISTNDIWRGFRECFNSTTRGYTMPVFTFEKISPPVRRGPIVPIANEQRGVIVQILGHFVEKRVKRKLRKDKGVIARHRPKPSPKTRSERTLSAHCASAGC